MPRFPACNYSDLADREERADKDRMAERLERLRLERQAAVARPALSGAQRPKVANDNLAIGLLRLMQIYHRRRNSRARARIAPGGALE